LQPIYRVNPKTAPAPPTVLSSAKGRRKDLRKRTSKSICGYLKILRKNTGNRIVDRSLAPAVVYRGALLCGEKVVRLGGGEYRDAILDY